MAGTPRPKRPKVVDIVAAARELIPLEEPTVSAEFLAEAEVETGKALQLGPQKCPLGHDQPAGVRFCGQCGMDMSAPPPSQVTMEDARPVPTSQLSPEDRAERDRQHLEAVGLAARFEQAPDTFQPYTPKPGESVVIHFVADGLTAFGKVWYRGEELEIGPDHPRWDECRGWILMDKWAQMERYGEQKFDQGPWPGQRGFAGVQFEQLNTMDKKGKFAGPTPEELARAEQDRLRRGRAVPARMM
jgi:hypothetical protein